MMRVRDIRQIQPGDARPGQRLRTRRRRVTRDGQDAWPVRPKRRLAKGRPPHLQLREAAILETFDQHQVARLHAFKQIFEGRLCSTAELVHQCPTIVAQQEHFLAARLAQTVGVLAGTIDVDVLVAVLDQRHDQSAR